MRIITLTLLAALGTLSCITARRLPAEPHGDEGNATAALARANDLLAKGDATRAMVTASAALARSRGHAGISPRTSAALTEIVAQSELQNGDADTPAQFATALSAWEKVPNANEDIARVAALDGLAMVLMNDDLAGAEKLYRRSLALLEQLHGSTGPEVIISLHYLLDLLDQECRITEFQAALAQLDRIYDAHPGQECAAFYRARFHALVARRQGDPERAFALMQQAMTALQKSEVETHKPQAELERAAYDLLGNLARDGGHYPEAARMTELESAIHVDMPRSGAYESDLALHFDYEASGDARRQESDEKSHVLAAHVGEPLFPFAVSALEACQPETGPKPRGWIFRSSAADDLIAQCFNRSTSQDAHVSVMMRVGGGTVVAAEAVGVNVEQASLECASHAVLALPIPGPHDFNFVDCAWNAEP